MAGTGTKRIIELTEASTIQSGDFIAVDSNARGTKKVSTDTLATSAALTAETNARAGADEQMSERMDGIEEQTALIQNPTKTVSGSLVSFTDGADMPMVACTAEITPKQSGTGTPSPDNVRPISGWESVNLYDTGKNMLEVSMTDGEVAGVTYTKNADGSISCVGTITGTSAKYISSTASINALKTGVAYVLTGGDEVSTDGIRVVSSIKNADGSVARWIDVTTASGYTFTLSEGQTLTSIYLRGATTGTAVNVTIKPMIRLASEDATFEPYNGITTTVNLGRTVYGGTLDVVSGELTVTKEIIDLGSLTWQYNGSYGAGGAFYSTDKNFGYTPDSEAPNMVCSMYPVKSRNDLYSSADPALGVTGNAQTRYATIRDARYTDPTAFKTAMNGVQLVYPLATPQTYTLTGQEISTLLGQNNIWADSGDVVITYRRDISIVINNLESALNG